MGRIGSFPDWLELSMKRATAYNSGGGRKEGNGEGSALMESGGADFSLSPFVQRRADGGRAEEMTVSSCSKDWEWVGTKRLSGQITTGSLGK